MYTIINGQIKKWDMWIPVDADNADYREYQSWLDAGNTPTIDISAAKDTRRISIEIEREALLSEPIEYNGNLFDASPQSVFNLIGTLTFLQAGYSLPAGFTWRTADNINVLMTAPDISLLGGAIFARQQIIYAQSFVMKDLLIAASTVEGVNAVQWPDV